jgi:hypothetical protein
MPEAMEFRVSQLLAWWLDHQQRIDTLRPSSSNDFPPIMKVGVRVVLPVSGMFIKRRAKDELSDPSHW